MFKHIEVKVYDLRILIHVSFHAYIHKGIHKKITLTPIFRLLIKVIYDKITM